MAAPAAAQETPEQTVEGAQQFLAALAGRGQLVHNAHYFAYPAVALVYRVTSLEPDQCRMKISGHPYAYVAQPNNNDPWVKSGDKNWSSSRFENLRVRHDLPPLPAEVDWSRVTKILLTMGAEKSESGSYQTVLIQWSGGFLTLDTPDLNLARRIEYAANFLKEACDPTAATGF